MVLNQLLMLHLNSTKCSRMLQNGLDDLEPSRHQSALWIGCQLNLEDVAPGNASTRVSWCTILTFDQRANQPTFFCLSRCLTICAIDQGLDAGADDYIVKPFAPKVPRPDSLTSRMQQEREFFLDNLLV